MSSRCKGLLGVLFGHKFIKDMGGYVWPSGYCYRCGMPQGGWKGTQDNE
jgi:hypothetical protein